MDKRVVRVIGPPGTGKTEFGMSKVEQAIASGIHPSEILYSSFTRAAAYEAAERAITKFIEFEPADFRYFRTCHSIAFRMLGLTRDQVFNDKKLSEFGKEFGYELTTENAPFGADDEPREMVLNKEYDFYEFFYNYWANTQLLKSFDTAYKNFTRSMTYLPGGFAEKSLRAYIERRDAFKRKNGLYDFCDMLLLVLQGKVSHPENIRVAILDEAQDNAPLMFEFQRYLSQGAEETYWIADPDQAIHTWMGATPQLFLDIKGTEPDIVLRQSYRCPVNHHDLSQKVIKRNKDRYPHADFMPTNKEGWVKRVSKINWDEIIGKGRVLFVNRTRFMMNQQFKEMMQLAIPFMTNRGVQSPLQHTGRDVVSTFIKLHNGGAVTVYELHRAIDKYLSQPYLKHGTKAAMKRLADEKPNLWVRRHELPLYGFTGDFLKVFGRDSLGFIDLFKKMPDADRIYFVRLLGKYGIGVLEKEPDVLLSTIHGVKGRECEITILNTTLSRRVQEGYEADPESETRVFYVGLTRARDGLIILQPFDELRVFPV